jgi:hypothetical protein
MSRKDEILDYLSTIDRFSLRFSKVEDINGTLSNLISSFRSLPLVERDEISAMIANLDFGKKLISISGLLAESAVHNRDKNTICSAIFMHAIEDFRKDYRENFLRLVLIKHSSSMIGVDLISLVSSIEDCMSNNSRIYFTEFLNRDNSLNRLQSIGIRADGTGDHFKYAPIK